MDFFPVVVVANDPPIVKRIDTNGLAKIGDILKFSCTTDWSRPVSSIEWTINQEIVPKNYVILSNVESDISETLFRRYSEISFVLNVEHFSSKTFDSLTLTCRSVSVTPVTRNGN